MRFLINQNSCKVFFLFGLLIFFFTPGFGQVHTQVVGDSVLIHSNNGTGELILENATKNVGGFLFNKGNGRTEFRRGVIKLDDSLYLVGGDTIKINNLHAGDFIFNQTTQQSTANFHIDGQGTLSSVSINGKLDAPILNLKLASGSSNRTPFIRVKDSLDSTVLEIRAYYKVIPEETSSLYIGNGSGANTSVVGEYSGINNTALGHKSMASATTGSWNTAMGRHSLASVQSGNFNTAIGEKAMTSFVIGEDNTAVGQAALYGFTSGNYNVAVGSNTLMYNTNGSDNTALGVTAGYQTTGSSNVFIGRNAGRANSGSGNIFIGNGAGQNGNNLSNKLYIHNSNSNSPLIFGDFQNNLARINGKFSVSSLATNLSAPTTSGITKMVITDDQGQLSFTSQPNSVFQILTDNSTITWNVSNGPNAKIGLGGNRSLIIANASNGDHGTLIIAQDNTGARTLSLPANSKVANGGGGVITLSSAANAVDFVSWIYDGTTFYWKVDTNYN